MGQTRRILRGSGPNRSRGRPTFKAGAVKGAVIAVLLDNGGESIPVDFAIAKAVGNKVPLNTRLSLAEQVRMVAKAGCGYLLFGASLANRAAALAVVARPGSMLDHDRIRAALRDRLAPYKILCRFVEADSLPRNPTGKVLKADLRVMAATASAQPSSGDR